MNKLVSIIVPIYNAEVYLKCCIESLLHQTYRNIEIILVNDGSTDNSMKICLEYKGIDPRIVVLDKSNGGLSDARNCGIDISKGDYLLFVDSDDFIHPQMTEGLVNVSESFGADISICRFSKIAYGEKITYPIYKTEDITGTAKVYTKEQAINELFDGSNYLAFTVAWNKLYKKDIFKQIRYPYGRIHEDEAVAYKLFLQANRIVFTDTVLYYYVQREGSIMGAPFTEKRFDFVTAYRERMEYMIANRMFEEKAVKLYFWKYVDMLSVYKETSKYNKDIYRKHRKQLKTDYRKYRCFLHVKERIKCFLRIYFLNLYQTIRYYLKKMR